MRPENKSPSNNNNNPTKPIPNDKSSSYIKLNSQIEQKVKDALSRHPQYKLRESTVAAWYLNDNDQSSNMTPITMIFSEVILKLHSVQEKIQQQQLTKKKKPKLQADLLHILYYYRFKLAELFIQRSRSLFHKIKTTPTDASKKIPAEILKEGNSLHSQAAMLLYELITAEKTITKDITILGECYELKLQVLVAQLQDILSKIYIVAAPNFYHFGTLIERATPNISIFQSEHACFICFTPPLVVNEFIDNSLSTLKDGERRQFIVYPTALPDDTIVIDATNKEGCFFLTLISFNHLISFFEFAKVLSTQLRKRFDPNTFQIAFSLADYDHLNTKDTPRHCLELCEQLNKIDLSKLMVALQQQKIPENTRAKIASNLMGKSYYLPLRENGATINDFPAWNEIINYPCIDFGFLSGQNTPNEFNEFLIKETSQVIVEQTNRLAALEQDAEKLMQKNPQKYQLVLDQLQTYKAKYSTLDKRQQLELQFKTYRIIVEYLEPLNSNEDLNLYFHFVCNLAKTFLDAIDEVEPDIKKHLEFSKHANKKSIATLQNITEDHISASEQVAFLFAQKDLVIAHLTQCEQKRPLLEEHINPRILNIFDYVIQSSTLYLERIWELMHPNYLTYISVAEHGANNHQTVIECFKSPNITHLSYPNPEVVLDFFIRALMPLQQSAWPATSFIIYPTLDPQTCFLLKVGYSTLEKSIYLLFISANPHPAQIDFMRQLQELLAEHQMKFKTFQYQQDINDNHHLLPELYLNLADFLRTIKTRYIFDLYLNDLLRERILFDGSTVTSPTIPNAILLNPNLFIPKTLKHNFDWKFIGVMPIELTGALLKCNSILFIRNTLLFVEDYGLSDIEKFEKVVLLAQELGWFDIQELEAPERSPLQIALQLGLYQHADILRQHGADFTYRDSNQKTVQDYFLESLTPERFGSLRQQLPELCSLFEFEILIFELNIKKERSMSTPTFNLENTDDDSSYSDNVSFEDHSDAESEGSLPTPDSQIEDIIEQLEQAQNDIMLTLENQNNSSEPKQNSSFEEESIAPTEIIQRHPFADLATKVKTILDANPNYYATILNALQKIEKEEKDDGYNDQSIKIILEKYNAICNTLNSLTSNSKSIAAHIHKNNLFLYFYFTTRFSFEFSANAARHAPHNFQLYLALAAQLVKHLELAEQKLQTNDDPLDDILLRLYLDEQRANLYSTLDSFYLAGDQKFALYEKEKAQTEEHLIEFIRNRKSHHVYYLDPQFVSDFLEKIQKSNWLSRNFLLFPVQQPHLSFLLCVSRIQDTLHILFISATAFEAQQAFIEEFQRLLKSQNIDFKLLTCYREFSERDHMLPSYLLNIAKSLKKSRLNALFNNFRLSLIPKEHLKKIIAKDGSLKADLFMPEAIHFKTPSPEKEQQNILTRIENMEYLQDIMLFKQPCNDIEFFEKIANFAKENDVNEFHVIENTTYGRSPLQIALKERLYAHALVLVKAGAMLEFSDRKGKSVAQYFCESIEENNKGSVKTKKVVPQELLDIFEPLIKSRKSNTRQNQNNNNTTTTQPSSQPQAISKTETEEEKILKKIHSKNQIKAMKRIFTQITSLTQQLAQHDDFEKRMELMNVYIELINKLEPLFLEEVKHITQKVIDVDFVQAFYRYNCLLVEQFHALIFPSRLNGSLNKIQAHHLLTLLATVCKKMTRYENHFDGLSPILDPTIVAQVEHAGRQMAEAINLLYQTVFDNFYTSQIISDTIIKNNLSNISVIRNDHTVFCSRSNSKLVVGLVEFELYLVQQKQLQRQQFIVEPTILPYEKIVLDAFHADGKLVVTVIGLVNSFSFFDFVSVLRHVLIQKQIPFVLYIANANYKDHLDNLPRLALDLCKRLQQDIDLPFLISQLSQNLVSSEIKEKIIGQKFFHPVCTNVLANQETNILEYNPFQFLLEQLYFNFALFTENQKLNQTEMRNIQSQIKKNEPLKALSLDAITVEKNVILQNYSTQYKNAQKLILSVTQNSGNNYQHEMDLINYLSNFQNANVPSEKRLHLHFYFIYQLVQKIIADANNQKEVPENVILFAVERTFFVHKFRSDKVEEQKVKDTFDKLLFEAFEAIQDKGSSAMYQEFETEKLILAMESTSQQQQPKVKIKVPQLTKLFIAQINKNQASANIAQAEPDEEPRNCNDGP